MQKPFQFFTAVVFAISLLSACAPQPQVAVDVLGSLVPPTIQASPTSSTPAPTSTPTATPEPSVTPPPFTKIVFTGVIVPARCVEAGVEAAGSADYIYDHVRDILAGADITVGTYNAAMSDNVAQIGCQATWELTGSSINADALQAAGFDVMSVATNHIKDCGRYACGNTSFFDTLDNLRRVGIQPVGGGENLNAALEPVVVEVNGVRFGFVSLGEVNPLVFSDYETPGIADLTYFHLQDAIQRAKAVSDVVIVMPHSGPEDEFTVTPQQKFWANRAVEMGADLVVENHAHVVQGYQAIGNVMVFYGLGNFVFDQVWSRDHQQGVILEVTFQNTTMVEFELIPTVVLQDGTVLLADESEAEQIINRIQESSDELDQGN